MVHAQAADGRTHNSVTCPPVQALTPSHADGGILLLYLNVETLPQGQVVLVQLASSLSGSFQAALASSSSARSAVADMSARMSARMRELGRTGSWSVAMDTVMR
jgi:hypothetical protein